MVVSISENKGKRLLKIARQVIGCRLGLCEEVDMKGLEDDETLGQHLASFVTLKLDGRLRGCIGNLEPEGTLAHSVERNALNAAFHDYRFSPLNQDEFFRIHIEISVLSRPQLLDYGSSEKLTELLRPGVDGVILEAGKGRATFLPQVWEQLPDPEQFLDHLCLKAGVGRSTWRDSHPVVFVYQVQSIKEGTSEADN